MVDTLDQDLDIENDGEESKEAAEGKKNKGAASADADDEVQVEENDKADAEEEGSKTPEANDNEAIKESEAPVVPKHDYTLIDALSEFLYLDEDPLPILCGYFLKVMEQMLDKQKLQTLEYLLLHQDGKIFNGLLRHIDHHSLATLLIKLIEQQIQPEKKDRWDSNDNYDLDIDKDSDQTELTSEQKRMQTILKEKSTMVVNALISNISAKNDHDLHSGINSAHILTEFCENEAFFQVLTQPEVMKNIVTAVCSFDANHMNQPYALHFLTTVVNQFNDQDLTFFKDRKDEAEKVLFAHFTDLVYNCLMIIRSGETNVYTNQSGKEIRKIGILRIRAVEHLRAILTALSKRGASIRLQSDILNETMRKRIIEAMIFLMRNFQFCSISHQQGILVLNLIREAFDEEDLDTMKNFVKSELEKDNQFYYPSGKTTSRMNLGQIIKIAFELKHFTQKALDDMDSEDEEEENTAESFEKRSQLQSWFQFCESKVSVIEKTWNRKLENPTPDTDETSEYSEESKGPGDEHESTIEKMLMKFTSNRL